MSIIYQGFVPADVEDWSNINPWILDGDGSVSLNDYYTDGSLWTLRVQNSETQNSYRVYYEFAPTTELINISFKALCLIEDGGTTTSFEYKLDDVWTDSGLVLNNLCTSWNDPQYQNVNLDLTGLGSISGVSFVDSNVDTSLIDIGDLIITDTAVEQEQGFTSYGTQTIGALGNSFGSGVISILPAVFGVVLTSLIVVWVFKLLIGKLK